MTVTTELAALGMGVAEAAVKETLFVSARKALVTLTSCDGPAEEWFVPGRVEFLGKHTDYAGGRSLVCATERGFCMVARPRADAVVRVSEMSSGVCEEWPIRRDLQVPEGSWATYPTTVLRRVARDFPGTAIGFDLAFGSDLPQAAGLSSSSAFVVGVFMVLAQVNRLQERADFQAAFPTLVEIAGYLGALENGRAYGPFPADFGVGTQGGSQDQTAILCSTAGELAQFSWVPVRLERRVPFPAGYRLAIGVCGVAAEKTGEARGAYNAASSASVELLERWCSATGRNDPTLALALSSAPGAVARLNALLRDSPALRSRLTQFAEECFHLIPAAGTALIEGNLDVLGRLVDQSQAGAEAGLANQIPETIHLQRSARRLGAVAASAFGAGFGGSVWALVQETRVADFLETWAREYREAFPELSAQSIFFTTSAGPPAVRLPGLE